MILTTDERARLGVSPEALRHQAEIARRAGREQLARNFERGAELAGVSDETIFAVYEALRPGRAESFEALSALAQDLREQHGAEQVARLIEEAAHEYRRRNLFQKRF